MTLTDELNMHPGLVLWFDDLGSGNEKYNFLSNFYEGEPLTLPFITWHEARKHAAWNGDDGLDGPVEFATGEHAFAAMKFWGTDYEHFRAIVAADDPNSAKAAGRSRKHPLREDWEIVKLDVMAAVIRAKFTFEREEGTRLLDTGDKMLVEGTWWGDEVWGVALDEKGLPGRNWLGTLLMARRAELRAMQKVSVVGFGGEKGESLAHHFGNNTVEHNAGFMR